MTQVLVSVMLKALTPTCFTLFDGGRNLSIWTTCVTNGNVSFWGQKGTLFGWVPEVGAQNGSLTTQDVWSLRVVRPADFQSISCRPQATRVPCKLPKRGSTDQSNFVAKPSVRSLNVFGDKSNLRILASLLVVTVARCGSTDCWRECSSADDVQATSPSLNNIKLCDGRRLCSLWGSDWYVILIKTSLKGVQRWR